MSRVSKLSNALCATASSSSRRSIWFNIKVESDVGLWRHQTVFTESAFGVSEKDNENGKVHQNFKNFEAFEINRTTTIVASIVALVAAIAFAITNGQAGLATGTAMVLVGILQIAGASYWVRRMKRHGIFEGLDSADAKETLCDTGCALEWFNAFFCLVVGVAMLSYTAHTTDAARISAVTRSAVPNADCEAQALAIK